MSKATIQKLIKEESLKLAKGKSRSRSASRKRSTGRKRSGRRLSSVGKTRTKSRSKSRSKSRGRSQSISGSRALNRAVKHVLHSRLLWAVCALSFGSSVGTYVASNPKLIAFIRDNLYLLFKQHSAYKEAPWYAQWAGNPVMYGAAWWTAYDIAEYLSYVCSALSALFAYKRIRDVILTAYKADTRARTRSIRA